MNVTEHLCKAVATSHEQALGKGISRVICRKRNEASVLVVIACCSYIFCCVLCARIIALSSCSVKRKFIVDNMKQAR